VKRITGNECFAPTTRPSHSLKAAAARLIRNTWWSVTATDSTRWYAVEKGGNWGRIRNRSDRKQKGNTAYDFSGNKGL